MGAVDVDVVVIGGGLVGLATARALVAGGRQTALVERNPRLAQETSARHSGVIHAGLYYPPGSLKARLCVEGRRELVRFCRRHHVEHRMVGKLIVATTAEEEPALQELLDRGRANGVEGLRLVGRAAVARREPAVRAVAGLLSTVTGIVSSDELAAALERDAVEGGAVVLLRHAVVGLQRTGDGWRVSLAPPDGRRYDISALQVVNAAGLWAGEVAALAGETDLAVSYCKGSYFWTPRDLVRGLVYPLPETGLRGLGVHTTVDLGGRVRFGPDTEWVDGLDYGVDPGAAARFGAAVRRYLPALRDGDLRPDTAGIRPKLDRTGRFADFVLRRGPSSLVTLAGIESPGLTACLALGRAAARIVEGLDAGDTGRRPTGVQ